LDISVSEPSVFAPTEANVQTTNMVDSQRDGYKK